MAHLKTQIDLLTKHLLLGKTEKVKAVESQGTVATNADEEENYVSNQGVSEAIAKEIKVETITTKLVTRIEIKGIGRGKIIGVEYIYLLEAEIMLQLAVVKCPWRTLWRNY